ncbi:MAG TPA: hypothetical protein VJR89_02800 [Polyangiales bacterium]|nr:hypothetical protein [Polyangiales bacterium]
MTEHRVRLAVFHLALLAAIGCEPTLGIPRGNRVPTAEARVKDMESKNVTFDYTGSPVKVTLDGSLSKDTDGKIVKYRWLSARKVGGSGAAGGGAAGGAAAGSGGSMAMPAADDADGGTTGIPDIELRWVPEGAPPDWPDDVMQPEVELPEGQFAFTLWVEDDRHVTSAPSTINITVRTALPPEVQACVETVVDTVPSACKACVCGLSDQCRMAANKTVCDAACWGLLRCISTKCPTYPMTMDVSCLTANCSAELSGATGARMIGSCVTMCPTQCASM